jgi:hypothetical protein
MGEEVRSCTVAGVGLVNRGITLRNTLKAPINWVATPVG